MKVQLRHLKTLEDVARASGVEPEFIEGYANSRKQSDFFDVLKIPKRGPKRKGQYRVVFETEPPRLASFHRSMSMIVANSVKFGDHIQGYRKKYSTRTNAEKHLACKVLLHADIKGFFDSITTQQVELALMAEGSPPDLAVLLAKACTIEGRLRQGTRCSPMLANLVCLEMDQKFLRLASAYECAYTRYADNITFSGEEVPTDQSIRMIIESEGFSLRDDRCYRQWRGGSQFVSGLNVSDANYPRLPQRLKSRMRLTMHYIGRYGLDDHWQRTGVTNSRRKEAWLEGIITYAFSIEPQVAAKWKAVLDSAIYTRAMKRISQKITDLKVMD